MVLLKKVLYKDLPKQNESDFELESEDDFQKLPVASAYTNEFEKKSIENNEENFLNWTNSLILYYYESRHIL